MSRQDHIDRVWEIIEKVGVAMLTTRFPGGLRARPLEARPDRDAGVIWFVTDLRSGKEHEVETEHDVGLVFIDHKDKAYLSITARAEVRHDRAKAAEIWKRTDDAWWHGPDDPNVCLLRVRPITAELWDGPASAAVAAFEFAKARVTGEKPNLGENRKVTVNMMSRNTVARRSGDTAPPRSRPSAVYRIVWQAIRNRQQIAFTYDGAYREAFPHILGYKVSEEEAVLAYQVGGERSKGKPLAPEGGWGCFTLDGVADIRLRDGRGWRGGTRHSRRQTCIRFVDVDVNIPDTLTRARPLPFGSPDLLAPREPDE
jgi:general stress protein 26